MEININELIADAKAIKETAVINAKKQLEEAFIPRLNSIISARIQNEAEEDDDEQNAEISDTELEVPAVEPAVEPSLDEPVPPQPEAPVADPTAVATPEPAIEPTAEPDVPAAEPVAEPAVEPTAEPASEPVAPVAEPSTDPVPVTGDETEPEKDEDDIELESLMKELEDDDDDFTKIDDEDAYHGDPNYVPSDDNTFDDDDDLDEEIDLDEVLANFSLDEGEDCEKEDEEDGEKKEETVNEQLNAIMAENEQLKAELAKLRGENTVLESKLTEVGSTLSEVNLLNAKLLYTSKLFKNYNLNNTQKRKVVENFDRAKNIREVKLVYTTVAESYKHTELKNKANFSKITEGIASQIIASTQPTTQPTSAPVEDTVTKPALISENVLVDVEGANRLKKLAGIIKD
jgi:hypothetical protein